ncbi:nuclear transport factor 2 family protein [Myroides injenensis]|uniref:nuclear transport factor 2 family protein n=1 Tax=Myroides injenensis TaxID=1183151 RepID=UPI000289DE84|nr:nuclear transport factor 2 family protein [Myroides injenensis]
MTNLAIIKSTYEGRNSEENGQNLANHVATDIVWTEAKGFPYAGTYIGIEAIVNNVFKRLAEEWIDYKFTPQTYISEDNKVIAIGLYTGTYITTNKYFEARVVHIWTLNNHKITSFEQIVDSHIVVQAMLTN